MWLDSAKQIHFSEKDFYTDKNIKFHYHICDASNINKLSEINSKKFHRIMANHMLYHIDDSDRKLLLGYVNAMLTDDGKFIASTIGKNHMKEIFELAYEYDKNVKAPEWFSRGFILENGKEQLDVFFSNVTMFYHDNNLLIPDWRVIYDYLCSLPGIEKVMRKNKEASVKFLKDRVTESKPFFIRKSTGVFVAKKNFEG